MKLLLVVLTGLIGAVCTHSAGAADVMQETVYLRGTVVSQQGDALAIVLPDGSQIVVPFSAESALEPDAPSAGQSVVLQRFVRMDGSVEHIIMERYRLPWIGIFAGIFLLLAAVIGGKTGCRSVAGLALSIGILTALVLPAILAGMPPLPVSVAGAALIACTSIYIAHGIRRRTTLALIGMLITLAVAVVFAMLAVHAMQLFGTGSEEALFLQGSTLTVAQLRGLLLGGIVIGTLGVLDDITTAQTAAVEEISRANPLLTFRELYRAGNSVGKEHIASLMNTLALAYAGASLPLLLLFSIDADTPLWVILNTQFLAEEIARTIVGSSALILAVPISTFLAARSFSRKPPAPDPHRVPSLHTH